MKAAFLLLFALGILALAPLAGAQQDRGVINDPDGFTNVRARPDPHAPVVAQARAGEIFSFESQAGKFAEWLEVTLASGQRGWMHASRVRRHAVPADITDGGPGDEANIAARRAGLNYYALTRDAARGEPAALTRFFAFRGDGAAAETHQAVWCTVMHLLGDEKLARFLSQQSAEERRQFRAVLQEGNTLWPFEPVGYMKRNFPQTAKALAVR